MADDWCEKYRPWTLDDVVGQERVISFLKPLAEKLKNGYAYVPNFILTGPAGIGKTSIAKAFLRTAYGDDFIDDNTVYLNASDDNSINVMRDLKSFITRSTDGNRKNCVILDEADHITPQAQAALRGIMEKYKTCFFILTGNYTTKIIQPIRERCVFNGMRLRKLSKDEMIILIGNVVNGEEIDLDETLWPTIASRCKGNPRKAIELLFLLTQKYVKIGVKELEKERIAISLDGVGALLEIIRMNDNNRFKISDTVDDLLEDGVEIEEIVEGLVERVNEDEDLSNDEKFDFHDKMSDVLERCSRVALPELELKLFLSGKVFR